MLVLYMNDMRSPRIEIMTAVARADTEQELRDLIDREVLAERYRDKGYSKSFRKGGPLEWFNLNWVQIKPEESRIPLVGDL